MFSILLNVQRLNYFRRTSDIMIHGMDPNPRANAITKTWKFIDKGSEICQKSHIIGGEAKRRAVRGRQVEVET